MKCFSWNTALFPVDDPGTGRITICQEKSFELLPPAAIQFPGGFRCFSVMVELLAGIDRIVILAVPFTKSRTEARSSIAERFAATTLKSFRHLEILNFIFFWIPLVSSPHEDVHCDRQTHRSVNFFPRPLPIKLNTTLRTVRNAAIR
jgi:hypothetical protein